MFFGLFPALLHVISFFYKKNPIRSQNRISGVIFMQFLIKNRPSFCQPSHTKFLSSFRKSTLYSIITREIPFASSTELTVSVWK